MIEYRETEKLRLEKVSYDFSCWHLNLTPNYGKFNIPKPVQRSWLEIKEQ